MTPEAFERVLDEAVIRLNGDVRQGTTSSDDDRWRRARRGQESGA